MIREFEFITARSQNRDMKIFRLLLAGFLFSLASLSANDQFLYLSAGGKVTVFAIDSSSGELTSIQENELGAAGPIGISPDKSLLYVNSTIQDDQKRKFPAIATFLIGKDGKLTKRAVAASGMSTGYLHSDATGSSIAGNNYGQGTAAVWKLGDDGVYRDAVPQIITLEQKAHSAVFSPNNRFLLVPATGPNKVFQLRFDPKTGKVEPNDPSFANGPQGEDEARQPRHLIFHPSKPVAYTTNERENPGVGVWKWGAEKGNLTTVQNIVTQPEGFEGIITTADLHLTPDAKFLYVSNRDVTDRKATTGRDSIVGFSVDPKTGQLTMIGHTACEHVPRSFDVDETGQFVYVAGQGDDKLGVYRIDPKSGTLAMVTQYEVSARPSWVTCVIP